MSAVFNYKTISVIGLGYIGLPAAAMFASRKINVIGVDIDQYAIDTINEGKIHIVEPELDMIVHAAVSEGFLKATNIPEPADAFLIAVPTPFKDDHEPDLSYVMAAAKSIASVLKKGDVVILESTSPVGTTEKLASVLASERPDLKFPKLGEEIEPDVFVAYCPERVLPGQVVRELVENDRIIGGITDACSQRAIGVYRIFVNGQLHVTNARTAEMSKLTENSFRDVNIAFANELSLICDKLEINVWELIQLANYHPRVNILKPGCGVGGHCIAVDPWFIVNQTPNEAKIIGTARRVNDSKPDWVIKKVIDEKNRIIAENHLERLTVAAYGIAFKPDIDDLRESPALSIVERLSNEPDIEMKVVEPNISVLPNRLKNAELVNSTDALQKADIVLVLVGHKGFKNMQEAVNGQTVVIDTVGLFHQKG